MNLQLECEPNNGAPVDCTVRTVHIGHSYANTKCVLVPQTYECDANAGDDSNRVNDDCRNCGNRFFVSVNGGWVCARRLDHHQGPRRGWLCDVQTGRQFGRVDGRGTNST